MTLAGALTIIDGHATPLRLFRARGGAWAAQPAMRYKKLGIWQGTDWSGYNVAVRQVARALCAMGARAGEVSAVVSENRPEWVFADLGALHLGMIGTGIYPTSSPAQVAHVLRDSGAVVVFVENAEQLDKVLQVRAECPALRHIVVFDPHGLRDLNDPGVLQFGDLPALAESVADSVVDAAIDAAQPADIALLIYSSGTSGEPKGAMVSHANIMAQIANAAAQTPLRQGDRTLSFLPLCHAVERMATVFNPLAQGPIVHFPENAATLYADVCEVSPHLLFAPPRFWDRLHARVALFMPDAIAPARWLYALALRRGGPLLDTLLLGRLRSSLGLASLRHARTGTAPVAPALLDWFHHLGVDLGETYGLTETLGFCTVPDTSVPANAGRALAGIELRLNADGEILVRGPNVFQGYWRNPVATAAVLDAEGWLRTGDCGSLDAEGRLSIQDRMREIIILSSGEKIAPSPVENALKFSPYIAEAVVVGEGHHFLACLVLPDLDAVARFAQARQLTYSNQASLMRLPEIVALVQAAIETANLSLPEVAHIRAFRLIAETLTSEDAEVTPTLTLKRRLVSTRYADLIDDIYGGADRQKN